MIGEFGTHVDNSTSNFIKVKHDVWQSRTFFVVVSVTKFDVDVDNCTVGC